MNIESLPAITDKAAFLANAALLAQESLHWYSQLADGMELHNNPDATTEFRALESMVKQQLEWIEQQAIGLTLPRIAPWNFTWNIYNDQDSSGLHHIDYLSSSAGALKAALFHENQAEALYRHVAEKTTDIAVQNMANQIADQQRDQIKQLQQRLNQLPKDAHASIEDIDPPHIPE